jgi:hypothetical protein
MARVTLITFPMLVHKERLLPSAPEINGDKITIEISSVLTRVLLSKNPRIKIGKLPIRATLMTLFIMPTLCPWLVLPLMLKLGITRCSSCQPPRDTLEFLIKVSNTQMMTL